MDYDMIQIQIDAEAQKANSSIDVLVSKLNKLSGSLSSVGGAPMYNLASGVDRLGVSMQQVSAVRTAEFSRLSRNITKISAVNAGEIHSSATAINSLGNSLNNLVVASANAHGIGEIAGNISKLGNKGVQNAVTNIPLLATALRELMVVLSSAPTVNSNIIQMTNALANLASQGSKVGTASNTLVNGMNRTSTAMQRTRTNTFSLASAFGKFYASYFLVIRGIKGLWTSIESTADYIEAFNYFNVAFGKVASEWSKDWDKYGYENAQAYADSFTERINETLGKLSGINVRVSADGEGLLTSTNMKNLGLNIQEVTQYASQLASITNSVGQTGETTLAVSDAFVKLAGDISSLFNVDYQSVAKNLQSGLIGQSRALYRYGLDITQATLQTYAYAMGIEKSVSEMTQAEKMQLRYIAILDQSKVAFGDLANTINSPSNMIRQLSTNLKEASMVLGQLFIPLVKNVLPFLNGLAIALKNILVDIANLAGIKIDFSEFGQGYDDTTDGLEDIGEEIDGINNSVKKANKSLRSFDELLVIGSKTQDISETEDMLDLTTEILKATESYNAVWNEAFSKMQNTAQEFAQQIYNILVGDDWSAIGEKLGEGLVNFVNNVDDWINRIDWQKIGSQITTVIDGIEVDEIALSVLKLVFDVAKATVGIEWGSLKSTYEKYGLPGIFATFLGFSTGAGLFYRVAMVLGFDIAEEQGISDWVEENVTKPIEEKKEQISNAFSSIADSIIGKLKPVWESIVKGFTDAKNKVVSVWQSVTNWFDKNVVSPINKLFDGTKSRIEAAFTGAKIIVQSVWGSSSSWIKQKVIDPIIKNFSTTGTSIANAFRNAWTIVKTIWSPVATWFEKNIVVPVRGIFRLVSENIEDTFESLWTSVTDGVRNAINGIISFFESGINKVIDGVNKVIDTYNDVVRIFDKDYVGVELVPNITLPKVSANTSQVFTPNKMLVNQIEQDLLLKGIGAGAGLTNYIDEIERATYNGIKRAISETDQGTTDQNVVVQIDGNEVFNVVQRRANNYFNATGNSAFAY